LEDSICDPAVLEIASRVYPFIDREIENEAGRGIEPALVLKAGKVHSAKVHFPKGHPQNQMTDEELESKFGFRAHSGEVISPRVIDQLINLLGNLEQVDDISKVTQLFNLQGV
jgi:2-methylcitrate dehydratase PrpD